MLLSSALVLCLGILTTTTVFGQPRREECATIITEEDKIEMEKTVAGVNLNAKRQTGSSYDFGIYFHVIASNKTEEGGWVPQKQIDDQIILLNSKYAASGTRIRFHLLDVARIINQDWHENVDSGNSLSAIMKSSLHKGRSIHLNVYTVGFFTSDVNGYSTFPVSYVSQPAQDGIVLRFTTLPGGSSTERQGGTLVHESGHWAGLRHTFEGGCTGTGDGVADTPPEAEPAYGCPVGRISCPNSNLPDPIHNYMDYTDEQCRTQFTPGQIDLMYRSIVAYRSNPNV